MISFDKVDINPGRAFKIKNDPRITHVGRFIRRYSIDELPQLFNIIKGDMSIVGPRPERFEHVEKYSKEIPEFSFRDKVKGGLTGYAQVYGKYSSDPYEKLEFDLMYINNMSMILSFMTLLPLIFIRRLSETGKQWLCSAERKKTCHSTALM